MALRSGGECLLLRFAELSKDACCALGVQETYHHVLSAWTWSLVDEAYVLTLALYESFCYTILYCEGNVMYALTTFLQPFCYG